MVEITNDGESYTQEEAEQLVEEPPEDTATTDSSIEVTSGDESYTRDELDSGAHEPTGSRTYVGGADESSGPTIRGGGGTEVTQEEAEAIARGEATATEPTETTRTASTPTTAETATVTDSITGATAEQGLETETAPGATEAEQGVEREGGRVGNRARALEQQFLAQNPGFTAADVTVVRSGDTLRAQLTESARRRRAINRAQSLEQQYLEDVGLSDPSLVRVEQSEDRLVASLTRAGERAVAGLDIADQLAEQYGPGGFDADDFTLTRTGEGSFTASLTEEGQSLVEYLQDEDSARPRPAGRPPVTTIERYERYEAQEDTARPIEAREGLVDRIEGAVGAQRAESAGVVGARLRRGIVEGVEIDPTRDIEFTAEDGTLGATLSATGQRREAAMEFSQQTGVAVDPSEVRLDDEGGATLGPEARRRARTAPLTEAIESIETRGTSALRGAAGSVGIETDIEVDVPGEGPLRGGEDGAVPDYAVFFRTGLESEGGLAPSQRLPAADSRARLEDALGDIETGIAEFVEPRTGAFAEQYVPPDQRADLRASIEDAQFSTAEQRRQELAAGGIETLAESPRLFATGPRAIKDAADVTVGAGTAYATGDRERLGEIRTGIESAAIEQGVGVGVTAARDPGLFAARSAGTLVGSAFLFGGAAAVGPRTSLATRVAIQPGEEALGFGLHGVATRTGRAVGRPEAGRAIAERIAPQKEFIAFSEEAAIRTARGAAARTRQAAGRARARIRGEAEPRGVIPEGGLEPATGGAFEGYFERVEPNGGTGDRFIVRQADPVAPEFVRRGVERARGRFSGEIEQEPTDPLEEALERMERARQRRYDEFRQRVEQRHEVLENPYRAGARASIESEVERRRRRARRREVELEAERERFGRVERFAQAEIQEPGAIEVPRARAETDIRGDIEQRTELRLDLETELEQELELELEAEQELELELEFEGESEFEVEVEGAPRERRRRRERRPPEDFGLEVEYFEAPVAGAGTVGALGGLEGQVGGFESVEADAGFELGPTDAFERGPQRLNSADDGLDAPLPAQSRPAGAVGGSTGQRAPTPSVPASRPPRPASGRARPEQARAQPRRARRHGGLGDLDAAARVDQGDRGLDVGALDGDLDPASGKLDYGGLD